MPAKRQTKQEHESKETAETERPPNNRLTRLLFRPRMLMVLVLGVSGTFVVPSLTRWLPDLNDRAEFRLRSADIATNELPRPVPHDLVQQVVDLAALPEELSLLDDGVTAKVADAFRRHPWVAEVLTVRKFAPAQLTVDLRFRRPVAMVEVQQGVYPVDANGVLLPPSDFSVADTKHYPLVLNVQSTPLGPAGSDWGDINVSAAARLAETLLPHWRVLNLSSIHVPRQTTATVIGDDLQFELVTTGGSRILWGRMPGTGHPGELTAEQKINRLKKYLSDFGEFDRPHGPYEIDIRHWREISRRPVTRLRREVKRKKEKVRR